MPSPIEELSFRTVLAPARRNNAQNVVVGGHNQLPKLIFGVKFTGGWGYRQEGQPFIQFLATNGRR